MASTKATLSSLPTEIKTRIAELCHQQDDLLYHAFQDQCEAVAEDLPFDDSEDEESDDFEDEDENNLWKQGRHENPDYPHSLSSLSLVSKEWRDIAATFMFRSFYARKCADPFFLTDIGPRYGHLVTYLNISFWSANTSMANLLASLAHMPNARNVELPSVAELLEAAVADKSAARFATSEAVEAALRRVIQRAEVVHLPYDAGGATISLCCGMNMTKLEMMTTGADLPLVCAALPECRSLRTLRLMSHMDDPHPFRNAASLPAVHLPMLRYLDLHSFTGSAGLHQFIQLFSSSLEELRLTLNGSNKAGDYPPDPSCLNLPRLERMTLTGSPDFNAPLVRHLSHTAFPALRTCTWVLEVYALRSGSWSDFYPKHVLNTVLDLHKGQGGRSTPLDFLVSVGHSIDPVHLCAELERHGVAVEAQQGGVVIRLKPVPSGQDPYPEPAAVFLKPKDLRSGDTNLDNVGAHIEAALERIRSLKEQALVVGDRVQMSRIAEALQATEWLWLERKV
ncbi:hypothetical protein JCM10908_002265 [Rhodotorula pacifica]|uniref:uncharacterized protein n=1 Tax=Rhodotorula pacifica TaxID=1495444 RepID=UPI0031802DAE